MNKCFECKDCSVNRILYKKLGYTICLGYMSPFFDKAILLNKNACKEFKPVEDDKHEKDIFSFNK